MTRECERASEHALELLRGDDPAADLLGPRGGSAPPRSSDDVGSSGPTSADLADHRAECPVCRDAAAGAESLRAALDAWEAPEPPADLVERTLARAALRASGLGGDADPGAAAPDAPAAPSGADEREARGGGDASGSGDRDGDDGRTEARAPRRRTSVEILTTDVIAASSGRPAPTRGRLFLRLGAQAAAAALLFGVCTLFVTIYYPAIVHALAERRIHACQERLRALAAAAVRYRRDRPDGPRLRGAALREALVRGGYADRADLVCAGPRGEDLRERSFVGQLPALDGEGPAPPVFWDRFGNHSAGFNVAYADGRVEHVAVDDFAAFLDRRGARAAPEASDSDAGRER